MPMFPNIFGNIRARFRIGPVITPPPAVPTLAAIKTTSGLATVMAAQSLTAFGSGTGAGEQITIDPSTTYQTFQGVGAALSGSAAYCLMNYLTSAQRTALLTEMFGTNGFSYVRVSIGSSDFTATGDYTYDETAGDTGLTNFALSAADTGAIIPILQQILAINPNVRIIAAPWTPPTWMKTGAGTNAFIGGTFNATTANLTTYAQYFVKYVQAMQAQGIPIYAINPQNEPTNTTNRPSCGWATADMANFILNYLAPALSAASVATKIWAGDDSWNVYNGAGTNVSMLASGSAGNVIDSYAWHGYGGNASQMTTTHNSYPTKGMQFTEHRTLLSQTADAQIAQVAGLDIISVLRNWSQTIIFWNLALDQAGNPATVSTGRRGVVTIQNDGSGTVTRNTEYYALAHIAKYIQRGAVRINSTSPAVGTTGTDIETVAFKNPDGSIVTFLWNGSTSDISMSLVDAVTSKFTNFTATARAMMTVQYSGLSGGAGEALAISGAPAPNAMVGASYDFLPTVTGGSGTRTFALTGTLPSGMSFSTTTGEITGSPTATGTATGLNISVTDTTGTVSLGAFSIQAYAALSISNSPASTGAVGTAYSYTPSVSGGSGTYSKFAINADVTAEGLSFNTSTGAISGTPTAGGTISNATITVTDSAGNTFTTPFFGITIAAGAAAPTVTAAPSIAGGTTTGSTLTATTGVYTGSPTVTGQWYSAGVAISGATGSTYTLAAGDVGNSVTYKETATNGGGSVTSTSNAIGPVTAAAGGSAVSIDTTASSYPATATAGTTTTTWSHTIAANANLVMVAIALGTPYHSGADYTWTSTVTIGGVAATRIASLSSSGSVGGHDRMVEIWALQNPPTGSQSVVATVHSSSSGSATSNIAGVSTSYINATGYGTAATAAVTSGSATSESVVTTGGSANGVVFAIGSARSTTVPVPGTGQTSLSSGISGTNMAAQVTTQPGGTGSITTSMSITTADQMVLAAVPILSN